MLNRPTLQFSSLAALAGGQTFFASAWHRLGPLFVLGLFFSASWSTRGADLPLTETNLIPEKTSLFTESMLWDKQLSFSTGLGYKDNVLLSALYPRGSAFFVNGLDCIVIRLPLDGWQVEGSVVGDDIRYWHTVGTSSTNSTSSEDSFIGSLKVQRELPGDWKAGLAVLGAYENQVLDISPPLSVPATALVEGENLTATPFLRKDLGSRWWLQLEMPVTRWWLAAPLDDDWEFGPVVTAGLAVSRGSALSLSYGVSYQDHNSWTDAEYDDGVSDPGYPSQKLSIFQQRAELAWQQYWDAHQRWRSSTQLIFADLQDNGGGYYNEYQYQIIQDLRWQTADWMIKGSVNLTYEDYPIQWIGAHNGNTLYRNLWEFSFEVERRLYKGLRTFAKAEYQRSISNEDFNADDYHATTISGGLRYEF